MYHVHYGVGREPRYCAGIEGEASVFGCPRIEWDNTEQRTVAWGFGQMNETIDVN